jgi:Tfp pilus assembly protein PilZ
MGESATPSPAPTPSKSGDSSSSRNRADLRRSPRFKTDEAEARIYVKGFLASLGIGRKNAARGAVNLSEGGILVMTDTKLKAGSRVQVRLEFEKYKDVIECEGEVRWCYQSARDAADFYAGIEFRDLPPAQTALIGKMRSWYTSPEYRQKSATKKRLAPPEFLP